MEAPRGLANWSLTWGLAGRVDRRLFIFSLIGYFIFLILYFLWQSPACDESSYFDYAVRWAKGHPERIYLLDDSKSPMVFPALWIMIFKPVLPWLTDNSGAGMLQWGRLGMGIYVAALAWFLFCWLYRLVGSRKWYLPWLLFLFDPLVISNSLLIGSDIASATFWLASAYLAWRLGATQKKSYALSLALCIGMGMAVKPSMIFLMPMAAGVYFATLLSTRDSKKIPVLKLLSALVLMLSLSLIVLNAAYQFNSIGKSFDSIEFRSRRMQQIQKEYVTFSSLPLPLSMHFITAYDLLLRNAETGGGYGEEHSYRGVFLNGSYKEKGSFYSYYVYHFFYKTTPLLLLCLIFSLPSAINKLRNKPILYYAFIWFPAGLFFFILSLTNPFQIGIRHALPLWPFLYIAATPGLLWITELRRFWGAALLMIHFIDLGISWPNLTAYTPFWMQPKHLLWQRMNDSSLQYCNDWFLYRQFLKNNPEYEIPGNTPKAGKFAIRIEDCNPWPGDGKTPPCWLTRYFLPEGHYKTSVLLYHISIEQVANLPVDY